MPSQRAFFTLFTHAPERLDFEHATKLAGIEPTTIRRIGEPRKIGTWEFDHWRYAPPGATLDDEIAASLAFIKPGSPFCDYARTVHALLRINAVTNGSQQFVVRSADLARLHATGSVLDVDAYWPDSHIEDDFADASARLSFLVDGDTVAETPMEPALGATIDHLETRIAEFAARARAARPTGGAARALRLELVEHGQYQGSVNIHLTEPTIAALDALDADLIINLKYETPY